MKKDAFPQPAEAACQLPPFLISTKGRIRTFFFLFLIALCFWGPLSVQAGIYSYKDQDGCIHITDRPVNGQYKLLLTTLKRPKGFERPIDTGARYNDDILGYSEKAGISYPLLLAIIKTESNFNPQAVSPKGARGLMQLMPGTWKMYGVTDPFDVKQNLGAGIAYFREQLARFRRLDLALAAYNAGPGAVEKYGGVPPYEETRGYIEKVKFYQDYYSRKKNLLTLPGAEKNFQEGYQALTSGDDQAAAGRFSQVVRRFPGSPEANFNLALAYEKSGRLSRAAAFYRKAIEQNRYFKEAYYNLAIVFERLGRIRNSIETWQAYLRYEIRPDERKQVRQYIKELGHLARQ
ncbi:MAG: transglycosylase SLT domain-containing protein [Proteobacteria bacterium]|nr:transglycosylase SLT domain-containing protein [Pseudomonadota bacterium]